jgi:predicted CxxxxCH...CXXCH cytochrome family protein
MPQQCNGCHSYPGLDNTGTNLRQMSAAHRDHVGVPGAGGTANSKGFACTVCHYSYTHNQAGISAGQAWTSYNAALHLNVRFDSSWNAGSPTYNGVNASTASAPGNGGSGTCAGLYCHGNNATQSTWGGAYTQPAWNNPAAVACGTCHGAASTYAQGNHPAHLSAAFGPGSTAFTAGGTCSEGTGCHTAYGLTPTTTHVDRLVGFRTSPSVATQVGLGSTQICVNCHTNYTSANVPVSGDNLARTRTNWDNTTYKLNCLTCHNGAAWQTLAGTGDKAGNIDNTYYFDGHGGGIPDNASTASAPPVACSACHDELGAHIGTAKDAANPWRIDPAANHSQTGGLDQFCLQQCHSTTAAPPKHAWRVNGSAVAPAQAKDAAFNTHPTSMQVVPRVGAPASETINKDRWFLVPTDNNLALQGDLVSKPAAARTTGSLLVCVSCHDPHGVGTALAANRSFSGVNTEAAGAKKMLRYNYSGTAVGASPLCAKCHI